MRFSFRWRLADDGKRFAVSVWHQAGRLVHRPHALTPLFLNISESLLFPLFLNTSEFLFRKRSNTFSSSYGEIGALSSIITKLGHLGNPLKFPLVRSRAVVVIVVVGGPFEHLLKSFDLISNIVFNEVKRG